MNSTTIASDAGHVTTDPSELKFSTKAARRFCGWIDPSDGAEFDFRLIGPQWLPHKEQTSRNLRGSLSDDDFVQRLRRANREGLGVFLTANATDGQGVKARNIVRIRAVFADFDDGMPDNLPLAPSFVIETSEDKFQAWWLVRGDMPSEQFRGIMDRLVRDYGGDNNAKDLARVLRVPGFWHLKDQGRPFRSRIMPELGSDYSTQELLDAFPPVAATATTTNTHANIPALLTEPFDADKVRSALSVRPAHRVTDRQEWLERGFELHHGSGGSDEGFTLWCEWSSASEHFDERGARKVWASFSAQGSNGRPRTLGSLFHWAKGHGWEAPNKPIPVKQADGTLAKVEPAWPAKTLQGKPAGDNLGNVVCFLRAKGIEPWFNEFDRRYYLLDYEHGDELDDAALRDLRMQMHALDCKVSVEVVENGAKWLADRNKQHPLRVYLDGLKWDGVERIDDWLTTYVGAKRTKFSRAAGRAWLIMAVRRVRQPGCLARTMLVLEGPQDIGKSTVFRVLAGEPYYTDSLPIGAEPKIVIEESVGKWIIECAELERKTKRQVGEIRTFISRVNDTARTAFSRVAQTVQRQFVLAGTTNASQYLNDKSGNVRFWPVKVGQLDIAALRADRDQLWAEAAHYEGLGEPHWFTGELAELAAKIASRREVNTYEHD